MSKVPLLIERFHHRTIIRVLGFSYAVLFVLLLGCGYAFSAPDWTPQSSEKLIKIPASSLKKSIDRDFSKSALGTALKESEENISLKGTTLQDLKNALETADGEVRKDLRLKFLDEKRRYLSLMSERNQLRIQQLATKERVFNGILKKLNEQNGGGSVEQQELIALQDQARSRFETSFDKVDRSLFSLSFEESKYSQQYSKNQQAIDQLLNRIANHRMGEQALNELGESTTQREYVRQLLNEVQSEQAVLSQEETILGYMAKLVSLDALALAEDSEPFAETDVAENKVDLTPSNNVSFFLEN